MQDWLFSFGHKVDLEGGGAENQIGTAGNLLGRTDDRTFGPNEAQWQLRTKDTQGTMEDCPEYRGGLISHVHFHVMKRPGTEVAVLYS